MEHNNTTSDSREQLQDNRRDLEDVTLWVQELVGTLTVYVDQALITPKALPLWLAGFRHLEEHDLNIPENQDARRLAYLWLLDALIQSPAALTEAAIAARNELVAADEALQPFAG